MKLNGVLIPVGGGASIPLVGNRIIIGREKACAICLPYSDVSRCHCELTLQNGCWKITDLGSKNGVKVNGVSVKVRVLASRDTLTIGKRQFMIRYTPLAVVPTPAGTGKAPEEQTEPALPSPAAQQPSTPAAPAHSASVPPDVREPVFLADFFELPPGKAADRSGRT